VSYFVWDDGEKAFTEIIKFESNKMDVLPDGVFTPTDTQFKGYAIVEYKDIVSHFLQPELISNLIGNDKKGFLRWQT